MTEANAAHCARRVRSANQTQESAAPSQAEPFHWKPKGRCKENKFRQIEWRQTGCIQNTGGEHKVADEKLQRKLTGSMKALYGYQPAESPEEFLQVAPAWGCEKKTLSTKTTACAASLSQHTCVCSCSARVKILLMCSPVPKTITEEKKLLRNTKCLNNSKWKLAWCLLLQDKSSNPPNLRQRRCCSLHFVDMGTYVCFSAGYFLLSAGRTLKGHMHTNEYYSVKVVELLASWKTGEKSTVK